MADGTKIEWDGCAPAEGWHWLRHRKTGEFRMAFWQAPWRWRVADAIGRTAIRYPHSVARLFTYHGKALRDG